MDPVIIGEIIKVHGVRGEVVVRRLSDVPQRYRELETALVVAADGSSTPFAIERVRETELGVVVKFRGIDVPETAQERLLGRSLAVERDSVPPHAAGENYHFELIGLEVVRADGPYVGVLESIIETGANDVYVVRGPAGEVLIPAIHEVVEQVDVAAGRMVVRPLPGLFEPASGGKQDAGGGAEAGGEAIAR
jgi:16S rRNA processing protein RimM